MSATLPEPEWRAVYSTPSTLYKKGLKTVQAAWKGENVAAL